ncbi:MAG: DUF2683 family protein [Candidatus Micrarchaeota archaeon]
MNKLVKAIIDIDEHSNRIFNIVKAKYGLKDKSEAIELVAQVYEEQVLEPELKPEYETKIKKIIETGKFIKVDNFAKRYKQG